MGTCLRLARVMRDATVHSSSLRLQIALLPGRHTAAPIRRSTSDSHPKTPGTLHRQGVCHYLRPGCGEVLSGLPGRERLCEQAYVRPEQAVASARKQEWEHLKKGFY